MRNRTNSNSFFSRPAAAAMVVLAFSSGALATALDASLESNTYDRDNRLDTLSSHFLYDEIFTLSADNLATNGLSFFTDLSVANAFDNTYHKQFEVNSFILEYRPDSTGLGFKAGRYHVYDLIAKNLYTDGVTARYELGKRFVATASAGIPVPSRYNDEFVNEHGSMLRAFVGLDVNIIDRTWAGLQVAREKDSVGAPKFRAAVYADSKIGNAIGIKADVRGDITDTVFEEASGTVDYSPRRWIDLRLVVQRQARDSVDSVDAYTSLILSKHTDIGVSGNLAPAPGQDLEVYYTARVFSATVDHLIGITGSLLGANAGFEAGIGGQEPYVKPFVGYAFDAADGVRLYAAVRYFAFEEMGGDSWEHSFVASAGARWDIQGAGIVVMPELQYLTNEAYGYDVRFFLNAKYNFKKFW